MASSNLVRGSVVKCQFPYVERPHSPGPKPHYCLFIDSLDVNSDKLVAVCYGTSRLDDDLIGRHNGAILSVDNALIKGSPMPGRVAHFACSRVAVIRQSWIYTNFNARLDFIRPERRFDALRARMFELYERLEPVMVQAALAAVDHYQRTGRPGLPQDATLR
jgi:hypothetical protein